MFGDKVYMARALRSESQSVYRQYCTSPTGSYRTSTYSSTLFYESSTELYVGVRLCSAKKLYNARAFRSQSQRSIAMIVRVLQNPFVRVRIRRNYCTIPVQDLFVRVRTCIGRLSYLCISVRPIHPIGPINYLIESVSYIL